MVSQKKNFASTVGLVSFFLMILIMLFLQSEMAREYGFGLVILFLLLCFVFIISFSMFRGENLQENAVLRIRKTIESSGISPFEAEELTENVVRILKSGSGGDVTWGSDSTLGQILDSPASVANWTEFSSSDLANAIRLALEIRDRRKN